MPEEPKRNNPKAEAGNESSTPGTKRNLLRLAEAQWAAEAQSASLNYQHRAAMAMAEYQQALAHLAGTSSQGELDALKEFSTGSPSTPERDVAAVDQWRKKVESSRAEAQRSALAANRKLAESLQQAWFESAEEHRRAAVNYQTAIQGELAAPGIAVAPSVFAVAGDEGLASMVPANWLNGMWWTPSRWGGWG